MGQMIRLVLGDCIEQMRGIPSGTIGAIISDPPYGLSFMGKDWDRLVSSKAPEFLLDAPAVDLTAESSRQMQGWHLQWLKECYRILRPGGVIKAFSATRTQHRLAAAMEEAGFTLNPEHSLEGWSYGSGFPKSLNVGKALEAKLLLGGSGSQQLRLRNGHTPGQVGTNMGRHRSGATHRVDDPPSQDLQTPQGAQFQGFGTALKPAWEPFLVGVKSC
jgi:site-specific DNA-methyltransferase (adenine-specific)